MNRRTFLQSLPAVTVLAGTVSSFAQEELKPISLPKPRKRRRQVRSGRSLGKKDDPQHQHRETSAPGIVQSSLAAFGVNREKGPSAGGIGRTAASASNSQEIDLYIALPEGIYVYEAVPHRLAPVVAGDFRAKSGRRATATAPVNIFYVVDLAKYAKAPFQEPGQKDTDIQKSCYYIATGLIAANVYLFAASQGLAAHFHNCDKQNTPGEFKLRPEQRVLFAQTVGYPA